MDHAGKTCCCVILPTGVFDLSSYLIFNNFGQYFFHHFCKKKQEKCKKTRRKKLIHTAPFGALLTPLGHGL